MTKEKSNQNQNKEECPLCQVSEETIQKLKDKEKSPELLKPKPKKGFPLKFKILLLIIILIVGGFVFYKFSQQFLPGLTGKAGLVDNLNFSSERIEVDKLAPDFSSEDVDGNKVSLSDFKDKKPVLLVIWATWCGFCVKELPGLKSFVQEHQDKIQVIAVSSSETRKTIKDYIEEKDVNFLMLLDENREIWNQYLVRGTPAHFLIDSQGKIVSLRPGLASREDLEIMLTMLTEFW